VVLDDGSGWQTCIRIGSTLVVVILSMTYYSYIIIVCYGTHN